MSRSSHTAIRLREFSLGTGEAFDWHVHPDFDQLALASGGVLMVSIGIVHWMLPPSLALWIPAGTLHATSAVHAATMHGVYLPHRAGVGPAEPTVVRVSPLLRELIAHLHGDLDDAARRRAEAILPDLLLPAESITVEVPTPTDTRAAKIAAALAADPSDPRDLTAWGREVGASTRTLTRIFAAETGMSFTRWRTLVRLRASLANLSRGDSVSQVAARVGFASASAFIAAFRSTTGLTPGAYFAQLSGGGQVGEQATAEMGRPVVSS